MTPAKGPACLPVRFSPKLRTISLTFCAKIGTFHLERSLGDRPRETWRATELHVSFRVRTHETTNRLEPSDWAGKHKTFLAPIRSQNGRGILELVW